MDTRHTGNSPDDSDYHRPGAEPLLARTGHVGPMGTLIADLKTKVDPETKEAFDRIARCTGGSNGDASSAMRNYVYWVVHGKTYDKLCDEAAQRRRALLIPQGHVEGLMRPGHGEAANV